MERHCSECGTLLPAGANHCPNCGASTAAQLRVYATKRSTPTRFAVGSLICAITAVFLLPPLFGLAGAVLGILAYTKDRRLGTLCIVVSLVAMGLGMALGIFVATA